MLTRLLLKDEKVFYIVPHGFRIPRTLTNRVIGHFNTVSAMTKKYTIV